jgi:TolA-binding protein
MGAETGQQMEAKLLKSRHGPARPDHRSPQTRSHRPAQADGPVDPGRDDKGRAFEARPPAARTIGARTGLANLPWLRLVCVACGLLAAPVAAHAQVESREGIALQNQLYQLRQDLQQLHADVARNASGGGGGGGDIAAQLLSRVQAMEEQVRQLRGRIDETQNLITRQNADLSKRIDDLTFQMNLQGRNGSTAATTGQTMPAPPAVREVAPRPAPDPAHVADMPSRPDLTPRIATQMPSVIPPPPSPPPQSFTFNQTPEPMREVPSTKPAPRVSDAPDLLPPPPIDAAVAIPPGGKRTPELALQEGHAALARRDYAAAEKSAREVMNNRASPRAYDGQFLLAESLAGQKQYAQAAIAFDDTYNRSHKGRYAQEALVGLAGALTAINEKKAACDTLGRLRTEFPQVRADLRDTITRTNQRAGCGAGG